MVRMKCEKWVKTVVECGESLLTTEFGLEWFLAFHTNIKIT